MAQNLGPFLDELQSAYHRRALLSSDPLEFVYSWNKQSWVKSQELQKNDPLDQEAVALLCAVLAYGNVKQIRRSINDALQRMLSVADSPRKFVEKISLKSSRLASRLAMDGFVHRFNTGRDLICLFELLQKSWKRYGSLGSHFLEYLDKDDPDISSSLSQLISTWREWLGPNTPPTFSYLLTSPADGSCCKRWCMFLRWMGRKDSVDPGLWTKKGGLSPTFKNGRFLSSHQLVMPLDTHTGRISQYLGLTSRKTLDWKAALEVTSALKKIHPQDPTRYDFALSRLGILEICQRSYREEICQKCQLLTVCRFAKNSYTLASASMRF